MKRNNNMRYIIINSLTQEPIKQSGEVLNFRNYTTAEKYFRLSLKEDKQYFIKQNPDTELKEQLNIITNEINDIYHAIENAKSDTDLLLFARTLQDVLKKRRKIKNKLHGARGNPQKATQYKNRTCILMNGED